MKKSKTSKKASIRLSDDKALNRIRAFPKNTHKEIQWGKGGKFVCKGKIAKWFHETNEQGIDANLLFNLMLHRCLTDTRLEIMGHWGAMRLNSSQLWEIITHDLRPIVEWWFEDSEIGWFLCFGKGGKLFGLTDEDVRPLSIRESVSFHRINEGMEGVIGGGNEPEAFIRWLSLIESELQKMEAGKRNGGKAR